MSDHVWAQEHIAAHVAGGLDPREVERIEAHARDCPACGAALAEVRRLDRALSSLFAGAGPGPGLEDRAVARLRDTVPRSPWLGPTAKRCALAAASALALGGVGAVAEALATGKGLVPVRRDAVPASAPVEVAKEAPRIGDRLELDKETKPFPADDIDPVNGVRLSDGKHNGLWDMSGHGKALTGHGAIYGSYRKIPTDQTFDPTTFRPAVGGEAPKPDPVGPGSQPPVGEPAPAPGVPPGPGGAPVPPTGPPKDPDPTPEPVRRVVIRSGDMEFEVESFDAAAATVAKLVSGLKGAFVGTVNSDKLPNGKVRGAVTVRVPPEHLDGLVLDLRRELGRGGELKGVRLTSQDVTKAYTDTESRLKGARTMEQRLLQIIKEGKGEIKQLLEAERELGVWRTKVEEFEGELRYYANRAALSTLTVTLAEKELRAAAVVTERERVQAGVEVEDVDKAYQQVLGAVLEANGRITKSELKQLAIGQFNATFHFEVAAEAGGPVRDRLRALGRVARLEIDRTVQTEGGTLPSDAKSKRGDTLFLVQLYNLANVAPRETVTLQLAAPDVPSAYQALRDAVAKTTGRVLGAQLNEQDRQNITAQFDFEVRRADEGGVRAALGAAGDVVSRQVARVPESDSVTDAKVLYRVALAPAGRLAPRETATLSVEVADVDGAAAVLGAQVAEAKGRPVDAKLDRDAQGRSTARLVFEVPLAAAPGLVERLKGAGTVRASQSVRDPQATEGRFATARLHVTLTNAEAIVPDGTGVWPKVREGLSISASVLLTSVTWVVFGLCVVLPWALIGLGGYRLVRRFSAPEPALAAPADPAVPPPPPGS